MSAVVQPGVVLAGNFRVEQLLGEGGMGVVVAAQHLALDRLVALKFMLPQALSFPQAAERFMREGRVLERFEGENTPRIVDSGYLENGAPYFAMEYVDGIDLAKLVRQYGSLSITDAVDFALQACAGVAEAHEKNVVHRDLKPGNLILTQRPDGSTLIKVLDFGLSKILNEEDHIAEPEVSQTQTTGTMGTPAFMSPEQARSAKYVDQRADVWSLGAILFHLLTARLPFPASATAEAFAKLLYDDPASIREVCPWVPRELEEAVLSCLHKDPDQRMPSAVALMAALRPFSSAGGFAGPDARDPAGQGAGPRSLDVPAVLQQRTAVSFGSLNVAIGSSLAAVQPALPPDIGRRAGRRRTLLAAAAGMLVGAGVIGALLFVSRSSNTAAAGGEAGIEALPAEGARALPGDPPAEGAGMAGSTAAGDRAPADAGSSQPGAEPDPAGQHDGEDDPAGHAGEPDSAGDAREGREGRDSRAGDDPGAQRERARKRRERRERRKKRRKSGKVESSGDDGEKNPPPLPPVERDPFDTIH